MYHPDRFAMFHSSTTLQTSGCIKLAPWVFSHNQERIKLTPWGVEIVSAELSVLFTRAVNWYSCSASMGRQQCRF